MTRTNRSPLKSLTQTGLHRIPHNPHQRVAKEGGAKTSGIALDAFNDKAIERYLHPTKGFRRLNVKRSRAQMLVANILQGRSANMRGMKRFMALGY